MTRWPRRHARELPDGHHRHGERRQHRERRQAARHALRQPPAQRRVDEEADEREERESARAHRHHFSDVNASGLSDSRCRNSAMTSARPTAASAAATVITKNVMIWPSTSPAIAAERHERQVHGVQHDLDRQQDRDQVAAQEHAGRADGEQHRRDDQVVAERNHCARPPGAPAPRRRPSPPESAPTSPRTRTCAG